MVKQRIIEMNPHFWPKNPKANFLGNRANISSCKSEDYGTDPDFWLKNPKAKTNPIKPKTNPNKANSNPIYPELVEGTNPILSADLSTVASAKVEALAKADSTEVPMLKQKYKSAKSAKSVVNLFWCLCAFCG